MRRNLGQQLACMNGVLDCGADGLFAPTMFAVDLLGRGRQSWLVSGRCSWQYLHHRNPKGNQRRRELAFELAGTAAAETLAVSLH